MKILFVCTQNVFRSLSAQYLFQKYLDEQGITDFEIDSAGTVAHSWERPYRKTLEKLYELGVDAREHTPKLINEEDIKTSDLIICMSEHHREDILENYGVDTVLFNEIAYGSSEDLQDDVEADYLSLEDFIEEIIEYINEAVHYIAENIDDYL